MPEAPSAMSAQAGKILRANVWFTPLFLCGAVLLSMSPAFVWCTGSIVNESVQLRVSNMAWPGPALAAAFPILGAGEVIIALSARRPVRLSWPVGATVIAAVTTVTTAAFASDAVLSALQKRDLVDVVTHHYTQSFGSGFWLALAGVVILCAAVFSYARIRALAERQRSPKQPRRSP